MPRLSFAAKLLQTADLPISLLREGSQTKDLHDWSCRSCHQIFARSYQTVVLKRCYSCDTPGCTNSKGSKLRQHFVDSLEIRQTWLQTATSQLVLLAGSGNQYQPHIYECQSCATTFERNWNNVRFHAQYSCPNLDCSNFSYKYGEEHHSWNPNLTEEERLTSRYGRGPDVKRWYRAVLARDNYTCQISGVRGGDLSAHHITPWSRDSDLRYDLANGLTLSRTLHKEFHRLYGNTCGSSELAAFKQRYSEGSA